MEKMRRISLYLLIFAEVSTVAATAQQAPRKAQSKPPSPPAAAPAAPPVTQPVPQAGRQFPIDSIAIEGNRILPAAGIISASGLKTGQTGSGPIFDAARDRLLGTGYFDTVAYRYKPAGTGGYNVTFELQEIETMYPIRIESLPATVQEIEDFLKTRDPLFTGKMPGTQPVIRRTSAEIEQYLESKGHAAKVTGRMIATAPQHFEVQFTPASGVPVVSDVSFEGNKAISSADLHKQISEVAFGQPFTQEGFRTLLENQIGHLYEAKGYMKVSYPQIVTTPSTEVTGIDVKVTVDEGIEYKLTRVAVVGVPDSENMRILKTARLPKLTVANFEEVREAAKRVQESLRHQGYLDARVTTDKKVDEAQKSVEFFLVVDTGPAYTFGTLTVNGLGLDGEAAIRKIWGVKTGDAFPDGYPDYFLGKVHDEGLFDNLGATTSQRRINPDTHVVDVTLDFKGAPQKARGRRDNGGFGPPPF
jgi:outer membrane protein assembly factor BamA